MDPVIPPTPHRLPGHELFDLVAKRDGRQIRATFEGLRINRLDGGGYVDAYKGLAGKCPLPNLLQSITENHGHQPRAIHECPSLDRPDGGGYVNAYEGRASVKCILPNLLQPIPKNCGGCTSPCLRTAYPTTSITNPSLEDGGQIVVLSEKLTTNTPVQQRTPMLEFVDGGNDVIHISGSC